MILLNVIRENISIVIGFIALTIALKTIFKLTKVFLFFLFIFFILLILLNIFSG